MRKTAQLLVATLMVTAGVATATDYDWTSGTGNWTNDWSPVGYPSVSNDNAYVYGGTQNLTPGANPGGSINNVYLRPSTGTATLNISGDLSCRTVLLGHTGNTGAATINQTAGNVVATGWNYIGYKGTAMSTYTISGGSFDGQGDRLYMGNNSGAIGTLNVNGGTFKHSATGSETTSYIGTYEDATINMNDGTFESSARECVFGWSGTTAGTLNLTNGMFKHTGYQLIVARYGNAIGTMNIAGGKADISSNYFDLGARDDATGTINLSGGLLQFTGGTFRIGDQGIGVVNLSGGVFNSSADNFSLGYGAGSTGSSGTMNITNGATFTHTGNDHFIIGRSGNGTLAMDGGTLSSSANQTTIGYFNDGSGAVTMSGGQIDYTGNFFIVGRSGSGSFTQSGGTHNTRGLILSQYEGSDGTYSISGGTLVADKYLHSPTAGGVFEVDGSGAEKIETDAVLLFGGSRIRFNLDENGSTLVKAVGGYYDRGIELTNATVEVETLAGFSASVGETFDLMWTANGFLTNDMTFVDNSGIGFDWRIVAKDGGEVFQLLVPGGTPSEIWAIGFGLTGDDAAAMADPDNDGLSNLHEYGLGGDPTNSADTGISPVYGMVEGGGTNGFEYVYPRRSAPDSGLTYHLELTDDLVYTDWADSGYTIEGTGTIDLDFDAVTNRIPTATDERFVRLVIEE